MSELELPTHPKVSLILYMLESAGYKNISLSQDGAQLFTLDDGFARRELEFTRDYFDSVAITELKQVMDTKVMRSLRTSPGKRVALGYIGLFVLEMTA